MTELHRVGTTYIPVKNPKEAAEWYQDNLHARINHLDETKAILDLADQSFFLVKGKAKQTANFLTLKGVEHFTLTFEVNGSEALKSLHHSFQKKGIEVGDIENRGHPGLNFVFKDLDGNMFDVWSELSPNFKLKK
ncbi:VOC family protein [Thalassobacillus pellis]|uniref:VOC family protein n=1 Tax=Thalassobacillus pellis TaxID=748008 RepID=UPI00195FD4C2|nr:VOC family protein [Thalassobacillus pellis]MBM7552018.1 catechol-2,3-dioxygenase [Thalassobacillus pellis]